MRRPREVGWQAHLPAVSPLSAMPGSCDMTETGIKMTAEELIRRDPDKDRRVARGGSTARLGALSGDALGDGLPDGWRGAAAPRRRQLVR